MLVEGQAGEGEAGYQGHESLDAVAKIPRDYYKAYSRLAANQHSRNLHARIRFSLGSTVLVNLPCKVI